MINTKILNIRQCAKCGEIKSVSEFSEVICDEQFVKDYGTELYRLEQRKVLICNSCIALIDLF